jgi:L-asparaginase
MGMKLNDQGSLSPEVGYLTEQIKELPELKKEEMPEYTIKEYEPLLDSACMGPAEWIKLASDIEENYFHYDGFVIITGTDTMAYASSALSFMLENLGKTVVFTGSQIPFSEVYNDARRNLLVSIIFATSSELPEVCICFNDRLLRANRSVKVNSKALSAFDSPNMPPLATLGAFINERKDLSLPQPKAAFKAHKNLESGIIVLKLAPGFDDESIFAMIEHSKNLKAIVLEMYGTGNGPSKSTTDKGGMLDAIKLANSKGIVVIAVSQCLQGGVMLDTYKQGRDFKAAGVINGGDMTTEACVTKLAYLFGRMSDPSIQQRLSGRFPESLLIKQYMARSLRGEMTPPEHHTNRKFYNISVGDHLVIDDDFATYVHDKM